MKMSDKLEFILNNEKVSTGVNNSATLLEFIRKSKKLTGTKLVCREGDCGACTVLIGELKNGEVIYRSVTSCIYPIAKVKGKHVVTIEGINQDELNPVQKEFVEEGATQCGFCTPGFIMSLTWYLLTHRNYYTDDAINALGGNICRCTGYASIIRSTEKIIKKINGSTNGAGENLTNLIKLNVLPEYFAGIKNRLTEIEREKAIEPGNNENRIIVGGGTDLYVQKFSEMVKNEILLSENLQNEFITLDDNKIRISGNTTFEQFKESKIIGKYFPKLKEQLKLVASLPIRNSATIAGNIVNASPIGDLTIILLSLGSELVLYNGVKRRFVKLSEFYKGYKTFDLANGEIVEEIRFDIKYDNLNFNFEKVSKRTYLDIASVNSAMAIDVSEDRINSCKISAGGVAPVPLYLKETSEFLTGKTISHATIEEALIIVQDEISPISDVRGSEEYKRLLLNQLIKAHFIELFPGYVNLTELIL